MSARGKLRWRRSRDTGLHYYEDDKYGYAWVQRSELKRHPGPWFGNAFSGFKRTLKEAKLATQRICRPRRRSP